MRESFQGRLVYVTLQATREGQAAHAHVHEIVDNLRVLGWDVRLLEPEYRSESPTVMSRILELSRVQLNAIVSIARGADALYLRAHPIALPVSVLARVLRVPVVQEVNGPLDDAINAWSKLRRFRFALRGIQSIQLRLCNGLVAVTSELAASARRITRGDKVFVVPNGANTAMFNPEARPEPLLPRPFVVFVGAFAAWQGISTILDAEKDSAWPEDLNVVFVGDGALRGVVENAAASRQRIHYLGKVPYSRVAGIIVQALAGLSVQTDLNGRAGTGLFPLKLFETLACGVPVIVSDFPGQADLVREVACGLVVPPDSPSALARAVRSLAAAADESRRMGKLGHTAVMSSHSWRRRAETTASILRGVVQRGRRGGKQWSQD